MAPGGTGEPATTPEEPYLLSVGHLEPRKNHRRLIEAYAQLRTDVPLHLVGRRGCQSGG